MQERKDPNFVQGLARGLDIIRAFDRDHRQMTAAEVATRINLNRPSVRRGLLTLHSLGYVVKEGRFYTLSPKVLSLGYSFLSSYNIGDRALPVLKLASTELNENCMLGMPEGDEIVYVACSPVENRVLTVAVSIGSRIPILSTAIGRSIVAFMDDDQRRHLVEVAPLEKITMRTITDRTILSEILDVARQTGFCESEEEYQLGVRSLAVPVLSPDGRPLAAVSVVAPIGTDSADNLREVALPVLQRSADSIASAIF